LCCLIDALPLNAFYEPTWFFSNQTKPNDKKRLILLEKQSYQ